MSVSAGVMNLNVCARTFTSPIVCSTFGMWQSDALISWAIGLVMCMGFDARSVRTIGCVGAVTVQAYLGRRLPEDRLIGRAMNVVATEARNAARIHQTLYEVVALHAVLVGCSIGKVSE
jgi:hypothetical protein